ncbi:G3E family GTPase [Camelimonas lactis]|uniref:G3E family GTPase n=2 Tax=Camelimonas lactis TaxID=659006 RepID=A0A4R2GQ45_9HYPH|nr:G3E family GTPase [Camelimonas lactis]
MPPTMTADGARPAGPPPPLPLIVITGFLGAGKTTLLNRLLQDPALADTVVIINEFGDVGLDHLFVEAADEGLVTLSAGCLCCTVRGDLVATLEDLLRRRDNGRIAPFRRVVIETTGLADPAPVLQAVLRHPYLQMRYALAGVVTLVDAVNGAATLAAHPEAVKQAAVADRLLLTKTDLAAAPAIAALRQELRALNPTARLIDVQAEDVDGALLAGLGPFGVDGKIADVRAWLDASDDRSDHGHHHDHDASRHAGHGHGHGHGRHAHVDDAHGHDHDHHGAHDHHAHDVSRHGADIRTVALVEERAIPRATFEMFTDLLRSAHGPDLLRVKGLVKLAEHPDQPVVIHGVQHVFHPPQTLPAWPDADHRTRIVFIVRGMSEDFLQRMWGAFTGKPAVDAPDRAALTDNPLAPAGFRFSGGR